MSYKDNLALAWEWIPILWEAGKKWIRRYRLKKFFGPSVIEKDGFSLVFDPYWQAVPGNQPRCFKQLHGRTTDVSVTRDRLPIIGEKEILGRSAARALQHGLTLLSWARRAGEPVRVFSDEEVIDKWDGTFVCFGSRDSNLKTLDIESFTDPPPYSMRIDPLLGHRVIEVNGRRFPDKAGMPNNTDFGVIMRMKNPRSPDQMLIVCAGLGGAGTSGAAWFLFRWWERLHKRFGKRDFVVVVQVKPGSDETATEVHAHPGETKR